MNVVALDRVVAKSAAPWAVIAQLARREGLRILRHPLYWVGAVGSLLMLGLFTWNTSPVFHRDDIFVAGSLLPLGAATLIVANLAASRSRRNSTDELYDSAVTSAEMRTIAHLLSLAYPLAGSFIVAAAMLVYMAVGSPVGTPRVTEVLVGPFCVSLLGAIGIAIGRGKPHPVLGPMAVVVLIAIEVLLIQPIVGWQGTGAQTVQSPWFAPWVPASLTGGVPPELVLRPATWHLLYLAGLIVLVGAIAVARERSTPRVAAVLVVGLTAGVLGSIGQVRPPTDSQRAALAALVEDPDDHQVCRRRGSVEYCAYPAYVGWIDRWAAPVEGALALIPEDERPEGLVIRQRFGSYFEGPTDLPAGTIRSMRREHRRDRPSGAAGSVFYTGTSWGRGAAEGEYEIGPALHVAMAALDLPTSRAELKLTPAELVRIRETLLPTLPPRSRRQAGRELAASPRGYCYTHGQARALTAWWIAAQATPATRSAVTRAVGETPYGLTTYENDGQRVATSYGPMVPLYPAIPPPIWDHVGLGGDEFYYAASLLEQPPERVATVLKERWERFTEATTTTASVLQELDLEPHPTIEEQIAALPDDVELEQGHRRWQVRSLYPGGFPCP